MYVGFVGVGNSVLGATKAVRTVGEFGPLGTFHGKEELIDIAQFVRAAAEGSLEFGSDGERIQDFVDGAIE